MSTPKLCSILPMVAILLTVTLTASSGEEVRSASGARLYGAKGREEESAAKSDAARAREGTKLTEQTGTFEVTGDRITFMPSGSKTAVRCLENLTLERVARLVNENRSARQWVVSGIVTEYRGSNYLLLSRAILKAG